MKPTERRRCWAAFLALLLAIGNYDVLSGAETPSQTAGSFRSRNELPIGGNKGSTPSDAPRQFWAFEPLRRAAPPQINEGDWCRTSIDSFIFSGLRSAGLRPNPPADRRRLIRRVYLDLLGVPPSADRIEDFVRDLDPDAYPRLIDALLASPQYGERWGRFWLDLARFAESHGFEHDTDRPSAFHYRDFVLAALNQDMPYDQFVKWQIAGDEFEPENFQALTATGFLAAGVHSTQITANQAEKERYDELDDIVGTIGTSMLGLTIGCARCHDHKFDPIPTSDYYRLISTFTTTVRTEIDLDPQSEDAGAKKVPATPDAAPDQNKKESPERKALICSEGLKPLRLNTQGPDFYEKTYLLNRGDPNQKGREMTPGFLQVLMRSSDGENQWRIDPPKGWRTSYHRRALAEWITDVDYGAGNLLARVIVNRLWQHHFGRGIVGTPSDFGSQGERPSHPELLEWLAGELVRAGWRLKPIHRLLMRSAVYLQDSEYEREAARADPDNRLLWRFAPRRLESEAIRDSILAVTGALDRRMFGPGTLDEGNQRRSIYFTIKRSKLIPMMVLFDGPDALQSQAQRATTTVAPQALLMMNNPHVQSWSRAMAKHLIPDDSQSFASAVRTAYGAALGRQPSQVELEDSLQFLRHQTQSYGGNEASELALGDFCQALLILNEFVFID